MSWKIPSKPVKPTLPKPVEGTDEAVEYYRTWSAYWAAASRRNAWISIRLSVVAAALAVTSIVLKLMGY